MHNKSKFPIQELLFPSPPYYISMRIFRFLSPFLLKTMRLGDRDKVVAG